MRRLIHISFAAVLLSTAATGCFVSRKETIREQPRTNTTVERHTTTETIPGDTEVRTKTRVEHEY